MFIPKLEESIEFKFLIQILPMRYRGGGRVFVRVGYLDTYYSLDTSGLDNIPKIGKSIVYLTRRDRKIKSLSDSSTEVTS